MFRYPDHQVTSTQRQPVDFLGPLADKNPGQPLTHDEIEDLTAQFVERARAVAGNAREASETAASAAAAAFAAYKDMLLSATNLDWPEISRLLALVTLEQWPETVTRWRELKSPSAFTSHLLAALEGEHSALAHKMLVSGAYGAGKSHLIKQLLDDPMRPERATILRSLGRGAASKGHLSEAEYWYDKAARAEQAIVLLEQAQYLENQGLLPEAERLLREAIEGIHHQSPPGEAAVDPRLEQARALGREGRLSEAFDLLVEMAFERLRR
jgi:hypothetical protein